MTCKNQSSPGSSARSVLKFLTSTVSKLIPDPPAPEPRPLRTERWDHPALGALVRNPDEAEQAYHRPCWIHFRRFEWLRVLAYSRPIGREPIVCRAQEAVQNWLEQPENLVHTYRDGNTSYSLGLNHGVFDVTFPCLEDGREISPACESLWHFFLQNEESISHRVMDAMRRYASWLHREDMGFWDECEHVPPPEPGSLAWLATVVEFRSMSFHPSKKAPVILLHWNPEWDPEHGCEMILFEGIPIFIDCWSEVNDLLEDPRWIKPGTRSKWETDEEHAAFVRYLTLVK